MTRNHFLVSYDIADDKRRSKVFTLLRDNGDHVQYSVFFCELNRRELAALKSRLTAEIHQSEDQVLVVDLGPASEPLDSGIDCIGKPYDPTPRVFVV